MNIPTPKSMLIARPIALVMALLCMLAANAVSVGSSIYILTDGTVTTTAPSYPSSRLFDCKVLTYDEANSTGTVSIELYKQRRYDYGKTGDNTVLDVPGTVEIDNVTFTVTEMIGGFDATEYITEIKIPSSVTTIPESGFQKGKKLTTVTIPGSVEVISKFLCNQCAALESVTLNEGTTTISEYAFSSCNKARTAVTLTASDVTIGQDLTPDGSALIGNTGDPLALDDAFRAKPENVGYNFYLYNPYTDNWDLQDASGVVPTNQAYLKLANTISPVFTPYHNGVISSVENISVDAPAADAIYDIYGRPVTNPSAPGIYIINGKKVCIP